MKFWISRFLLIILLIIQILSLCSCWNYKEIDSLAIVSTAALDLLPNDKYRLTVEIINIKSEGKNEHTISKFAQAEGTTVFEAERNLVIKVGNELYWAHSNAFIFSKTIAENGLVPVLDWLGRNNAPRLDLPIFISNEKTAAEIVKTQSFLHDILGIELTEISKLTPMTKSPKDTLYNVLSLVNSKGKSLIVPMLEFDKNSPTEEKRLICDKTAIFKKSKMTGFIDIDDTKFFKLINGDYNNVSISTNIDIDGQSTNITILILDTNRKVAPKYVNDNITIEIKIILQVSLNEIMGSLNISDEETMKDIKRQCNSSLVDRLNNFMQRMQTQFSSDIFGFGNIVMQQLPNVFKKYENDWNEQFQRTNFLISSDIKILDTGLLIDSFKEE